MIQQRPTMNVAINELFKTSFSLFKDYDEKVRKEQIGKVNYIETIASQLGVNLTDVNLFDIILNNNNILLANESQINQSLMGFNREKYFDKIESEKVLETLSNTTRELLTKMSADGFNRQKRQLERDIEDNRYQADRKLSAYNEYMSNMRGYREQLSQLAFKPDETIIPMFESIMNDSRFNFKRVGGYSSTDDSMVFETTKDNIITYKNERAGLNYRVNLGTFKFRLTFNQGVRFCITSNRDNVFIGESIHPHVSSSGDLCLGNMQELFNEAMENRNYLEVFNIAMQVLENYNDSDPYINIQRYAAISGQIQPDGEIAETMVIRGDISCYECGETVQFETDSHDEYVHEECEDCGHENEICLSDFRDN